MNSFFDIIINPTLIIFDILILNQNELLVFVDLRKLLEWIVSLSLSLLLSLGLRLLVLKYARGWYLDLLILSLYYI